MLIANARIITPQEMLNPGWVSTKNGKIEAVWGGEPSHAPTLDAENRLLIPGFFDVHIHGAMGADVMDATPEALRTIARFCAQNGVTRFLPTTLTASHEDTLAALQTIRQVMEEGSGGAVIMGAHLEGPYINPDKAGAQGSDQIRLPRVEELRQYLDVGVIRLISLAPEMPGADEAIALCQEYGVTVSIAHTDATYEQASAAIERGVRHSTHTFNAMSGLHHRKPGTLSAVMNDPRVHCELIADTIHVHPGAMHLLWNVKGRDRVVLITDAMRAAGMPDGEYTLGAYPVTVANGMATLVDGTLAGSILTMPEALRNFQAATGETLSSLMPAISANAARSVGLAGYGEIAAGMVADFALLNEDGSVWKTIINGQEWIA